MNFPEIEKKWLLEWEQKNIFKKTLEKDSPKGPFVFFEGPPTANGRPGLHHVEPRAFHDFIPRFKTMQGYHVARKAGWDTHGLPVELEVEKQLGFKSKSQIEEFGIAEFNKKCQESVWSYKTDWEEFTRRIGYWVDLENAYITYKPEYIESLWWIIKQVWDKGLLYKDYRVTPHCPRCGTSLSSHELSQGYQDVEDPAVYVKFEIKGRGIRGEGLGKEYLVAWTTTPWTLPANVGLAVGKDIRYVKVKITDEKGSEHLWLAKDRLGIIDGKYELIEEVAGEQLVGMEYEPLFPFVKDAIVGTDQADKKGWFVAEADFVSTQDGSGIVHTAVMYGADDFVLGTKLGLPKFHLVDLEGKFTKDAGPFAGMFVKKADPLVTADLTARHLLLKEETTKHAYPFCWRCKTPVIYYAKDSWYIRMSELRDTLLAENAKIHWEPEHIKDGRFGEWLREVKDWAFSRERYWGTPLPIWESVDGDKLCIGSFEELRALAKDPSQIGETFDPHRPYVDEIVLLKDTKEYRRVPDVVDCWFDSGAMPFAQWHYPFENKELIDSGKGFPADYISEAIDQTRGWFYTLLAVSTLLGKERPFKNVICLGHVLDAKGKKMSKSLGNIVKPMEMIEKYGADAIRWYMCTINQPGESKRFDEKSLSEMVKKNFSILMNVVSFYEMFVGEEERSKKNVVRISEHILDRWILARLHKLIKQTTERLENYIITETVRDLGAFIDDLSTWYLRRSRDRMKGTDVQDKLAALSTLQECLMTLSKLLAPFVPFLAEEVYQRLRGQKESVHLEDWPMFTIALINETVLEEMGRTRSVVSRALERRVEAGLNIRQVLASMTIMIPSGELAQEYQEVLKDELNVKAVCVEKGEYAVALDLTLTPELVREGTVRELIRRVNALRKNNGLTIQDRIELFVSGHIEVLKAIQEHKTTLLHGTLADSIRLEGDTPPIQESFRVNEFDIVIGFVVK